MVMIFIYDDDVSQMGGGIKKKYYLIKNTLSQEGIKNLIYTFWCGRTRRYKNLIYTFWCGRTRRYKLQ